MADDPDGPYEGRMNMREVTLEEFMAYRISAPGGDWNIKMGRPGPDRYFIPLDTDDDKA